MPYSFIKTNYSEASYFCQYVDSYVNCGDKRCSECTYAAKNYQKKKDKNEKINIKSPLRYRILKGFTF